MGGLDASQDVIQATRVLRIRPPRSTDRMVACRPRLTGEGSTPTVPVSRCLISRKSPLMSDTALSVATNAALVAVTALYVWVTNKLVNEARKQAEAVHAQGAIAAEGLTIATTVQAAESEARRVERQEAIRADLDNTRVLIIRSMHYLTGGPASESEWTSLCAYLINSLLHHEARRLLTQVEVDLLWTAQSQGRLAREQGTREFLSSILERITGRYEALALGLPSIEIEGPRLDDGPEPEEQP